MVNTSASGVRSRRRTVCRSTRNSRSRSGSAGSERGPGDRRPQAATLRRRPPTNSPATPGGPVGDDRRNDRRPWRCRRTRHRLVNHGHRPADLLGRTPPGGKTDDPGGHDPGTVAPLHHHEILMNPASRHPQAGDQSRRAPPPALLRRVREPPHTPLPTWCSDQRRRRQREGVPSLRGRREDRRDRTAARHRP